MYDDERQRYNQRHENPPPVRDGEQKAVGAEEDRAEEGLYIYNAVSALLHKTNKKEWPGVLVVGLRASGDVVISYDR